MNPVNRNPISKSERPVGANHRNTTEVLTAIVIFEKAHSNYLCDVNPYTSEA